MQQAQAPNAAPRETLQSALDHLLLQSGGRGLATQGILETMEDRGLPLILVLFSAPFLIPVSIPGTSTPFGAMLGVLGITLLANRRPWVPRFLGARVVPHASLEKVVAILRKAFAKLERFLKPRHSLWVSSTSLRRLHGLYILLMAIVLAVPFPTIPFIGSNSIAAWPIFLLGLGLLGKDGLFVILAYGWLIPFCAYWLGFLLLSQKAIEALMQDWGPWIEKLKGLVGA